MNLLNFMVNLTYITTLIIITSFKIEVTENLLVTEGHKYFKITKIA